MKTQRLPGPQVALLAASVVCSVVSLAALLLRPQGTGNLRLTLNIIAVLLVIVTTVSFRRGFRGEDA